jgi:hypothetical protein
MSKVSKKTAIEITKILNSIVVWNKIASDSEKESGSRTDAMNWHDQEMDKLSKILGMEAGVKFNFTPYIPMVDRVNASAV